MPMTMTEVLYAQFRDILSWGGRDKTELAAEEIGNIRSNVLDLVHREISDDEVRKLFRSFVQEYWRTHVKKPYKRKAQAHENPNRP